MRFMMLYKPGRETDTPPTREEMEAMGRLIGEMASAGVLIATDGLQPSSKGVRVTVTGSGNFTVTDGPFAETKEQLTGFYLVEARDLNEAIQIASKIPPAREGSIEVRPVRDLEV